MATKQTYPVAWDEKAPRLATIAAWINTNTTLLAKMERGYCSTDRKIPGTRLKHQGKGREGTRLKVWTNQEHYRAGLFVSTDEERAWREKYGRYALLDHNAAEAYRRNSEVVSWLQTYLQDNPTAANA